MSGDRQAQAWAAASASVLDAAGLAGVVKTSLIGFRSVLVAARQPVPDELVLLLGELGADKRGQSLHLAEVTVHTRTDELLNYAQAATLLGCSERTLRRWVAAGSIPHVRLGGRVRFDPAALARFVNARRVA